MPAEQNKGGNIPAHNKHANGQAHKQGSQHAHIAQVFGRQVQRIGAEWFHKSAIHRAEQYKPEDKQHLKFL